VNGAFAEQVSLMLVLFAERLGLKWVQTYITEFGGDPSKVTM
jgi:carboxylesterase type B